MESSHWQNVAFLMNEGADETHVHVLTCFRTLLLAAMASPV